MENDQLFSFSEYLLSYWFNFLFIFCKLIKFNINLSSSKRGIRLRYCSVEKWFQIGVINSNLGRYRFDNELLKTICDQCNAKLAVMYSFVCNNENLFVCPETFYDILCMSSKNRNLATWCRYGFEKSAMSFRVNQICNVCFKNV